MGLLDIFGGGGSPVASDDPYAGLLSQAQQRAARSDALGALAGALARAAQGIDGRRVGFGQGLGLAAEAYGSAQEQGLLKQLQIGKLGQETENLKVKTAIARALMSGDLPLAKAIDAWGAGGQQGPMPTSGETGAKTPATGAGGTGGGSATLADPSKFADPRGKIPVIMAAAQKYGNDPNIALNVARQEGLTTFLGDKGKSGGAFQLYTGGGVGNDFQRDTGLDPLDPKNEDATIDYAMKHAAQHGWGAWNGAKKIGITGYMGIGGNQAAAPAGGGAPAPSGAPTAVLPPEFNMRPAGGYAGLLGGAPTRASDAARRGRRLEGRERHAVLPGESPAEYARRTGLQGLASAAAPVAAQRPLSRPALAAIYGGGDVGRRSAGRPRFGASAPGQGPLASSVANLPPMTAGPGPLAVGAPPVVPAAPPISAAPRPPAPTAAPPSAQSFMPQIPQPNTAATQQLLAQIAKQRMMAQAAGLGDIFGPFSDMVLHSPRYLGEAEQAKRAAGLPYDYAGPQYNPALQGEIERRKAEAQAAAEWGKPQFDPQRQYEIERAKGYGGLEPNIAQKAAEARFSDILKQAEQTRGAALDPAAAVPRMVDGQMVMVPQTRLQAARGSDPNAGAQTAFPQTPGAPPAASAPSPAGGLPGQSFYPPYETTQQKSAGEARGKTEVERQTAVDTNATSALSNRDTLTLVMNDLRNVHQGWGADTTYNFGRVMQVFDPAFKQKVGSYEDAEKALAEMTGKLVRATDPNPTLQQSERLLKSMPVRLNSEGGNERLYNRMAGFQDEQVNKSIAQRIYAADPKNHGSTAGFDSWWLEHASPIAYTFRRMPADQQAQMVMNLRQTDAGKAELSKLQSQIDFIEKNGLSR